MPRFRAASFGVHRVLWHEAGPGRLQGRLRRLLGVHTQNETIIANHAHAAKEADGQLDRIFAGQANKGGAVRAASQDERLHCPLGRGEVPGTVVSQPLICKCVKPGAKAGRYYIMVVLFVITHFLSLKK